MITQFPESWWFFVILGIGAGVLSGMLGVGSGIIIVPMLALFCGFEQKSAQGMSLSVMAPMALVGALLYWRNPEIQMNLAVVALLICGALAGALVGAELAAHLPGHILRKIFAIFLLLAAVRMFLAAPEPRRPAPDENQSTQSRVSSVR